MTQTNSFLERYSNNNKLLDGAMLKELILAGASRSKKYFLELQKSYDFSARLITTLFGEVGYELLHCSSDSMEDILKAAQKGAWKALAFGSTPFHGEKRDFFRWFINAMIDLSRKPKISFSGFAQVMLVSMKIESRKLSGLYAKEFYEISILFLLHTILEKDITTDMYCSENILEDISRILEDLEKLLKEDFIKGNQSIERLLEVLKNFFEGMLLYISRSTSLIAADNFNFYGRHTSMESWLDKLYEEDKKRWMYNIVVLLFEMAEIEISYGEIQKTAQSLRYLVHGYGLMMKHLGEISDYRVLEIVNDLLPKLRIIDAPQSTMLAEKIWLAVRETSIGDPNIFVD
jgi:hypothetical protein